jgi:hypothetical protein
MNTAAKKAIFGLSQPVAHDTAEPQECDPCEGHQVDGEDDLADADREPCPLLQRVLGHRRQKEHHHYNQEGREKNSGDGGGPRRSQMVAGQGYGLVQDASALPHG